MMRGGYVSRHDRRPVAGAMLWRRSPKAWMAYTRTAVKPRPAGDEAALRVLMQRGIAHWDQADAEQYEEIAIRDEDREEARRVPLRTELESYFDHLKLPPLPPPLPRSSLWLGLRRPCESRIAEVRPFLVACEQGDLDDVKAWIKDKKDVLQKIGVQDGLACAADANQPDVARYLLDDAGASVHGAVVQAACRNRSLPLLELCVQHGYHPDQQIPANNGGFGVALTHCLDNEAITRFLLDHGASPDVGRFLDDRTHIWGERTTPPMDRTSGLALDLAADEGSVAVVRMLLEHGATPAYSRPLQCVVDRSHRLRAAQPDAPDDWRPLLEVILEHGADINATRHAGGTALTSAVAQKLWDIVEFLIEKGADPRCKQPTTNLDSFGLAAKGAGVPWEETEVVRQYLRNLCDFEAPSSAAEATPVPDDAHRNPLVPIIERVKRRKQEEAGP